jgi:PPOX class probable F420-dependent enzyme
MTTQTSPITFLSLGTQKYISLTTFRRSGAAIATPVWFARLEETVYVYSGATAGKVKRIRNNPQVQLAICTMRGRVQGPTISGVARIVTDPQEQARANAALYAKYWIARRLLGLFYWTVDRVQGRKAPANFAYLAVSPSGGITGPAEVARRSLVGSASQTLTDEQ